MNDLAVQLTHNIKSEIKVAIAIISEVKAATKMKSLMQVANQMKPTMKLATIINFYKKCGHIFYNGESKHKGERCVNYQHIRK